jgi:hypothetical protein
MIDVAGLEYAQARLCARNGERPSEADWQHFEVVRELRGALDAARATRLRHWTTGIAPQDSAHQIEATLRRQWRGLVAEVTGWMPVEWHSAVAWCGALAELPVLQYLARGGVPLTWMRDDPVYRHLCTGERAGRPPASGPLAPLVAAWAEPERFPAVWRAEWILRLPRATLSAAPQLQRLVAVLEHHFDIFAESAPSEGWALRRALQLRLASLFRRAVLDPAAAFVFLALSALDVERLRGELVRRAAFPRAPLAT